jgi:hypothetical protein
MKRRRSKSGRTNRTPKKAGNDSPELHLERTKDRALGA